MKLYQTITENANVSVQNSNSSPELEYLENASSIISDFLNIKTDIRISFSSTLELDNTQDGATIAIGESPNKIFIIIDDDDMATGEKLRVLCHEMVHAHQIDRGDLAILGYDERTNKITVRWNDEYFYDIKYSRRNPWELEAHMKEKELLRYVIDVMGNFLP